MTRLMRDSVTSTVCEWKRRRKPDCKANPSPSISKAQHTITGQKPCHVNSKARLPEKAQTQAKNALAVAGVSEQFGASSIRCSM